MYFVELEKGVYLCGGEGDPPRTLIEEFAKWYKTAAAAKGALTRARRYRPFLDATVSEVVI